MMALASGELSVAAIFVVRIAAYPRLQPAIEMEIPSYFGAAMEPAVHWMPVQATAGAVLALGTGLWAGVASGNGNDGTGLAEIAGETMGGLASIAVAEPPAGGRTGSVLGETPAATQAAALTDTRKAATTRTDHRARLDVPGNLALRLICFPFGDSEHR